MCLNFIQIYEHWKHIKTESSGLLLLQQSTSLTDGEALSFLYQMKCLTRNIIKFTKEAFRQQFVS
jgi:hypothetical protein